MNTKSDAVYIAFRQMEFWKKFGAMCAAVMVGLMLWVGWLLVQLHNCYAT